jgi:hypothetical protein
MLIQLLLSKTSAKNFLAAASADSVVAMENFS